MAQIYNTDVAKELIRGASIQVNRDLVPNQLAEKVVPVMEVNPRLLKNSTCLNLYSTATTTTGGVVLAAMANREIYLSAMQVTNIQDATSDNVVIQVVGTFDGMARYLYRRRKPTLTISNTMDHIIFNPPLKIDKNTVVSFTGVFTVGTMTTDVTLYGYITENEIK